MNEVNALSEVTPRAAQVRGGLPVDGAAFFPQWPANRSSAKSRANDASIGAILEQSPQARSGTPGAERLF
jgi:hypothetical protein